MVSHFTQGNHDMIFQFFDYFRLAFRLSHNTTQQVAMLFSSSRSTPYHHVSPTVCILGMQEVQSLI